MHMIRKRVLKITALFTFIILTADPEIFAFYNNNYMYRKLLSHFYTPLAHQNAHRKKSLKILIANSFFPDFTSTAILNQIAALIKRGHKVTIYAKRQGNKEWANPKIQEYNLYKKVFYNKLPPDIHTYDIIYCQFGYRGIEFLRHKKRLRFKAKLVTCFRGADISKQIKDNPHRYDDLFKIGDLFLPVCKYFKQKLIQLGCNPKKIVVHHSTVDCNKFSYKPKIYTPGQKIHIITVCRLVPKKGLHYAIHAIHSLCKKYPHIEYNIVGFGPLRAELEALINKLDITEHVKILGRASEDEVAELLDQSHIFLHPSITPETGDQEGIPNAIKEAMARGLPVLATLHSGIPELIEDGISGFLVPEYSVEDIIEKLEYLINHPELWEYMGLAGSKKIQNEYEVEKINDRLIKIFRTLLKRRRPLA